MFDMEVMGSRHVLYGREPDESLKLTKRGKVQQGSAGALAGNKRFLLVQHVGIHHPFIELLTTNTAQGSSDHVNGLQT